MTLELVITRGLPASGKTTYARKWVAHDPAGRARVNRDDVRHNLYGVYWGLTYEQEELVTVAQRAAVRGLLAAGVSVIVDDTNLRLKHAQAWAEAAADLEARFECVDITTPPSVCIQFDDLRRDRGERAVGAQVILDLADRYAIGRRPLPNVLPKTSVEIFPYVPDPRLAPVWLVDVDGTLALMSGRGPFEWHRVGEDAPNRPVVALARALAGSADVIVMSGRDAVCRPQTEAWLAAHRVVYQELLMRPEGDTRKDAVVKAELFWEHVAPRFNVLGVIDDRDQVVRMWRGLGLLCAQVAPGAF